MHVLVTGAAGQVGRCLAEALPTMGLETEALDRAQLDVTDAESVAARVGLIRPRLIINAAAYTAVDRAESEPDLAMTVNAIGPDNLARAAAQTGAALIHISSDYVFDGRKERPWIEADSVNPLGVYGVSKAAGEKAVRTGTDHHLIMRTAWVFSPFGHNFVKTMLRLGAERDRLRVVADQRGTPTGAKDIALALARIARNLVAREVPIPWGTYHFTCRGTTTWHGLAELVFDIAAARWGRRPEVEAIASAEYPTTAQRPANSVLDCTRFDQAFDLERRQWQESVTETTARLLAET